MNEIKKNIISSRAFACAVSQFSSSVARAADVVWANTGTDFNDGASYVDGVAPTSGDRVIFDSVAVTQPHLSGSISVKAIVFGTNGLSQATTNDGYNGFNYSGYEFTGEDGAVLTLTGKNGWLNDNANCLINATKGTNTFNVPIAFSADNNVYRRFYVKSGSIVLNAAVSTFGTGNTLYMEAWNTGAIVFNGDNSAFAGKLYFRNSGNFHFEHKDALSGVTSFEVYDWAGGGLQYWYNNSEYPLVSSAALFFSQNHDGINFKGSPFIFSNMTWKSDFRSDKEMSFDAFGVISNFVATSTGTAFTKSGTNLLTVLDDYFCCHDDTRTNYVQIADGCYLPLKPEGLGRHYVRFFPSKFVDSRRPVLGLNFDYFPNLGMVDGGIAFGNDRSRGGFAAFGGDRRVNFENGASLTNGMACSQNSSYQLCPSGLIFGHAEADGTVIFENPLVLTADRIFHAIRCKSDVAGRIMSPVSEAYTDAGTARALNFSGNGGTVSLEADNTFRKNSYIEKACLLVNGSVSCLYEVRNGGALGGTGHVNSVTVKAGGALKAGDHGGVLDVRSDMTLEKNSILCATATADNHGIVSFSGDGKAYKATSPVLVQLEFTNDSPLGQKIKIMDWSLASNASVSTAFNVANYTPSFDTNIIKRMSVSVEGTAMYLDYRRRVIGEGSLIIIQ